MKPKPPKIFPQTERQAEIERLAREYVAANPLANQADVAAAIGIDPSRLSRLRKRGRVVVIIPAYDVALAKRARKSLDGTRPSVQP